MLPGIGTFGEIPAENRTPESGKDKNPSKRMAFNFLLSSSETADKSDLSPPLKQRKTQSVSSSSLSVSSSNQSISSSSLPKVVRSTDMIAQNSLPPIHTMLNSNETKFVRGCLSNGEHYTGSVNKDMRPHGFGICFYHSGDKYQGIFENGVKHGLGSFISSSGFSYFGMFSKGVLEGKGTCKFDERHPIRSYEGNFKDNKFHGLGTLYYQNGDMYQGNFRKGDLHGSGVFYKAANRTYQQVINFERPPV